MLLVRAVVTGFGLALGSALFKEARTRLGWRDDEDKQAKDEREADKQDAVNDPGLQKA